MDAALLMEFVDAGHDLVLALSPSPTDEMRDIAGALGVDLDAPDSHVVDHSAYDADRGHTSVLATQAALSHVFSSRPASAKRPLVFSGLGLSVAPSSELATVALHGYPTSYSVKADGAPTGLAGRALGFVALVQARNNARAAVLASSDFLSDDLFQSSGNREVANDFVHWALSQRGVLRLSNVSHRIVGGEVRPERYRINDLVEFSAHIDELVDGQWVPFE